MAPGSRPPSVPISTTMTVLRQTLATQTIARVMAPGRRVWQHNRIVPTTTATLPVLRNSVAQYGNMVGPFFVLAPGGRTDDLQVACCASEELQFRT